MKSNWKKNVRFIVEMLIVGAIGILFGIMAAALVLKLLWNL